MFREIKNRIRLFFRKDKEPYLQLYRITGFYPENIDLYHMALMHKSCGRHTVGSRMNNERLEFLGDAVLGSVVADILFKYYANKQEGYLTTLRSKIVRRETLNKLAVQIGLDKLILHEGIVTSGHNSYMNGNAFEAFVGAIYLDKGYDACMKFMEDVIFKNYIDIEETAKQEANFKSRLIEWCQRHQIAYAFDTKEGRSESDVYVPVFVTKIILEGVECGAGKGYSKKESHQVAANSVMAKIRKDTTFVNEIIHLKERRIEEQNKKAEDSEAQMLEGIVNTVPDDNPGSTCANDNSDS